MNLEKQSFYCSIFSWQKHRIFVFYARLLLYTHILSQIQITNHFCYVHWKSILLSLLKMKFNFLFSSSNKLLLFTKKAIDFIYIILRQNNKYLLIQVTF